MQKPLAKPLSDAIDCNDPEEIRRIIKTCASEDIRACLIYSLDKKITAALAEFLKVSSISDLYNVDASKSSLLRRAITGGNPDCVRLVLDAGCDPDYRPWVDRKEEVKRTEERLSDIQYASFYPIDDKVRKLISRTCKKFDLLDRLSKLGMVGPPATPQDIQDIVGMITSGKYPLTLNDGSGGTALYYAAGYGSALIVKTLLDCGADPNQTVWHPDWKNTMSLLGYCRTPEIADMLIAHGARLDQRDSRGRLPWEAAKASISAIMTRHLRYRALGPKIPELVTRGLFKPLPSARPIVLGRRL